VQFQSRFVTLFFRHWKSGTPLSEVAARLDISEKSVRRLYCRFDCSGEEGAHDQYSNCGHPLDTHWKERAAQIRQEHPRWGGEVIRLQLSHESPGAPLPSARSIQRWMKELDLHAAPPGRRSRGPRPARLPRAESPHLAWQVDAAEEMKLKDGSKACWLRFTDECSGAFLMTQVFPHARWTHVDCPTIRESIRTAFSRWGLPGRMQVDNGYPWGSIGQFPPALSLWLIGLGIDMHWSWPACPQENGVVERSQGTGKCWAEPEQCHTPDELQQHIDEMDRLQREEYPHCRSTRWKLYPQLAHSGRRYTRRSERRLWEHQRVLDSLAQRVAVHQVDRYGGVSVYHYSHQMGRQYAGQRVCITLDPNGPTWIFSSNEGVQWRMIPAKELAADRILNLNVGCRKGDKKLR
jgi:hypothetical protein